MFSAQVVQLSMGVQCGDVSERQPGSLGRDKSAGLQTRSHDILRHHFQRRAFNMSPSSWCAVIHQEEPSAKCPFLNYCQSLYFVLTSADWDLLVQRCKRGLIYQLGLVVKPEIKRWRAAPKCLRYTWLNRQTRARTRSRTHRHEFVLKAPTSTKPLVNLLPRAHTPTQHTQIRRQTVCVLQSFAQSKKDIG